MQANPSYRKTVIPPWGKHGGLLFLKTIKKRMNGVKKGKIKTAGSEEAQHHLPIILFMQMMTWNENVTGNL
jgi:hypothetical protein